MSSIKGRCIQLASGENHTAVLTIPPISPTGDSCTADLYPQLYLFGSNEFGQIGQPITNTDELKQKYLFPTVFTSSKYGKSLWCDLPLIDRLFCSLLLCGPITNVFCGKATTFLQVFNERIVSDDNWINSEGKATSHYYGFGRNSCGELGIGQITETVYKPCEIEAFKGLDVSMV